MNRRVKITRSIWIYNTIYIAKTNCEQVNEKRVNFISEFADVFANADSDIILTECGKLFWKTKEEIGGSPYEIVLEKKIRYGKSSQ